MRPDRLWDEAGDVLLLVVVGALILSIRRRELTPPFRNWCDLVVLDLRKAPLLVIVCCSISFDGEVFFGAAVMCVAVTGASRLAGDMEFDVDRGYFFNTCFANLNFWLWEALI